MCVCVYVCVLYIYTLYMYNKSPLLISGTSLLYQKKKMHQTKHNSLPFLKNKKWREKELQTCSLKKGVTVIAPYICKNLWFSYFKGNIPR